MLANEIRGTVFKSPFRLKSWTLQPSYINLLFCTLLLYPFLTDSPFYYMLLFCALEVEALSPSPTPHLCNTSNAICSYCLIAFIKIQKSFCNCLTLSLSPLPSSCHPRKEEIRCTETYNINSYWLNYEIQATTLQLITAVLAVLWVADMLPA